MKAPATTSVVGVPPVAAVQGPGLAAVRAAVQRVRAAAPDADRVFVATKARVGARDEGVTVACLTMASVADVPEFFVAGEPPPCAGCDGL